MGTNYDALPPACENPCKHCRIDGVHIGKSLTMFQGYESSPWGPVLSWEDWKAVLRRPGVRIVDEYGHGHDVEEFIAKVEATEPESRRRQYDWMVKHASWAVTGTDPADWLDADGFSFSREHFS